MVISFGTKQRARLRFPMICGLRGWVLGVSVAAFHFGGTPAISCAFDMVKPERTTIDWIVDSETLVLARSGVDTSFAFEVAQVLVGNDQGPPIDQLVNSTMRRSLPVHTTDAVLFAHSPDKGWQRVAYVDARFADILDTALANRLAMSVHYGIADPHLQTSIQDAIDTLVAQRPEAGALVARQFSLRSDWSQTTVLAPLVRERSVALGDLLTISVYMARARDVGAIATGGVYEQ